MNTININIQIHYYEYLYKNYPILWIKLLTLNKYSFNVAHSILVRNNYTNAKHDIMAAIEYLFDRGYTNAKNDIYSDEYEQIYGDDNLILYRIIDYNDSNIITLILVSDNEGLKILSYVIDPSKNYTDDIINALDNLDFEVKSFSPAQMIYILQHSRNTPDDYFEILGVMLRNLSSNDGISYTQFTNYLIDNAGERDYTTFIRVELEGHFGLNLQKLVQFDASAKNYTRDVLNKLEINFEYDKIKYIIDQDQGSKNYVPLIDNILKYNYLPKFNASGFVIYGQVIPINPISSEEYFRVLELVLINNKMNSFHPFYDNLIHNMKNYDTFRITGDKDRIINLLLQYKY